MAASDDAPEEITVAEFKARYGAKLPKPPKPDLAYHRFLDEIAMFCLASNFDLPTKEYRFAHPEREWRFDLSWVRYGIGFEREGGTWTDGRHTRGAGYRGDCEKYNHAALRGWLLIRATSDMLSDGTAFAMLSEALRIRSSAHLEREEHLWAPPTSPAPPASRPRPRSAGARSAPRKTSTSRAASARSSP